jgi:hypothetical protein
LLKIKDFTMRFHTVNVFAAIGFIAIAGTQAWALDATSTAKLPEPVISHQFMFSIPFHVDKADQPSRDPVEVQLFVSVDRGANWLLYSRAEPSSERFPIRAEADGEYWFQVRTLDRSGQLRPESRQTPDMRVIVDTANAIATPTTYPAQYTQPAQPNQPSPSTQATQPPAPTGFTPTERPRMVNSRTFELVYDDARSGLTPAQNLELWGTTDGGQNWRRFAVGNGPGKPIMVNVDGEGIYGFKAVKNAGIQNGQGPRRGEQPEIWIGVDLSKPAARINSAREGTGPDAGNLLISWDAADNMLSARPVSLMYGETPNGPWNTIAAGLENTGRYTWPISGRLPRQIFLRIEVRDQAGNIGTSDLREAVAIDGFHPSVHISDLRSGKQPSSEPAKSYYR